MSVPAAQIARRCRRRAASARRRPRPLGDQPASAARPRPAARDASSTLYHYYVIDNLVDEARRQGD
eukprot:6230334-Prymnesium_polylepis.1